MKLFTSKLALPYPILPPNCHFNDLNGNFPYSWVQYYIILDIDTQVHIHMKQFIIQNMHWLILDVHIAKVKDISGTMLQFSKHWKIYQFHSKTFICIIIYCEYFWDIILIPGNSLSCLVYCYIAIGSWLNSRTNIINQWWMLSSC